MLSESERKRVEYVLREFAVPSYETDVFKDIGLETFMVFQGVLPPDRTRMSPVFARYLSANKTVFTGKSVLEIGTGSGILAVVMARHGAKSVVATDISDASVKNAQANAEMLHLKHCIEVRKGDLFQPVQNDERFDLIVFHHPFFCDKPSNDSHLEMAIMDDGGLIRRFLTSAKTYLEPEGKILLPFNEACGEGNDPQAHAETYRFQYIKRAASLDPANSSMFVYELIPR